MNTLPSHCMEPVLHNHTFHAYCGNIHLETVAYNMVRTMYCIVPYTTLLKKKQLLFYNVLLLFQVKSIHLWLTIDEILYLHGHEMCFNNVQSCISSVMHHAILVSQNVFVCGQQWTGILYSAGWHDQKQGFNNFLWVLSIIRLQPKLHLTRRNSVWLFVLNTEDHLRQNELYFCTSGRPAYINLNKFLTGQYWILIHLC